MSNRLEKLSADEKLNLITAIAQDQHAKAREIIFGQAPTVTPDIVQETKADKPASLDSLDLAPEQKAKLLGMLESYETATLTAREDFGVKDIPSQAEISAHVLELGKERLEKILSITGKPGLVIEPANHSMQKLHQKMNANLHYENQNEAHLENGYQWSKSDHKVSVWIVDKVSNSAVVPGQRPGKQRNDEQLRVCQAYYKQNGMELASDHTYAVALQQSLRAYKAALEKGEDNPEQHILDFCGRPQETVTMFDQEHNSTISKVAYGDFSPVKRGVNFSWLYPGVQSDGLRARGAVQLM